MSPLSFADMRDHVHQVIHAVLAAVDPQTAVQRHLQRLHHRSQLLINGQAYAINGRIWLLAAGKASIPMAHAATEQLGDWLTGGVVITKAGSPHFAPLPDKIQRYEAAHPVSDERSITATTAVFDLLQHTSADDLVLCLISGGASALMTQPAVPLPVWQALLHELLASGCTINEFNCVRRHLDRVKGGGLASWAAPASVVSLILSDVVGSPLIDIGSGPTVPDPTSPADAQAVLERYQIEERLETAVWQEIIAALTSKPEQKRPSHLQNLIIADVRTAAETAVDTLQQLGFSTTLLTTQLQGEAREAGHFVAAVAKTCPPGHAYVLGGETTVTLRGDGTGGRNLELALSAAIDLAGWEKTAVVTFATDGDDGPTQAAGGIATGQTAHHPTARPALDNNDSFTYFQQNAPDDLIITGLTGTNVNDLVLILKYPTGP